MVKYINKIINADCLDILKELPDKCIDLVLTDPPYGIGIKGSVGGGSIRGKVKECKKCNWDNELIKKEYFDEIFRISKNQIIFGGNYYLEFLKNTRCIIVWYKRDGLPERTFADAEIAWTSFDKNTKVYNLRWDGFIRDSKEPKEAHPTQKPLKLFEMILRDYSKENDLILDCFSGSGTTAVACHNLKRRFICIEKDEDYYKASVERLKDAQSQLSLF